MNPLDPSLLAVAAKATAKRSTKATHSQSLEEVAQRLGLSLRNGMQPCPFHDDKNPSLSVDFEKGVFHCFGCNKSGGVPSLVMAAKGCSAKDAGKWLREEFGTTTTAAPAPSPEPERVYPKHTLAEVKEVLHKWLHITDEHVIDIVFAFAIAEKLPGDPLWLWLIAPPGAAKTELLRSINGKDFYHLSDLTSKTFVSGLMLGEGEKRRKIDDLLPQLDKKVLLFKDFTTVLEKPSDERAEIFAQLRECYDGMFSKKFGTLDKKVEYTARFGLIAGVTPVVDKYWKMMQQLGERFLKYRWAEDGDATTRRAEGNEGSEREMRDEIQNAVLGYLNNLDVQEPEFPKEYSERLIEAAKFLAVLRTPVQIQNAHSDFWFEFIPVPEMPTRLVKQLKKLSKALAVVRGRRIVTELDIVTAECVARSTAPPDRIEILQTLRSMQFSTLHGVTAGAIHRSVNIPETTVRHILGQLERLKLVTSEEVTTENKETGARNTLTYFRIATALTTPSSLEPSNKVGGDNALRIDALLAALDAVVAQSVPDIAEKAGFSVSDALSQLERLRARGDVMERRPGLWVRL